VATVYNKGLVFEILAEEIASLKKPLFVTDWGVEGEAQAEQYNNTQSAEAQMS